MGDDLSNKIKQITDVLGQEKVPENLMGLLSLLANSASSPGKDDSLKAPITENPPVKEEKHEKSGSDDNTDMLAKVRKIMDRMNTANDPRVNLLTAIKPFMNNKRQKKINNCINLLRISSMAKYMDDNGKGIF